MSTRQRPAGAHSLLAFWHLLSLDAPSVASVWTLFIAWSAGVRIPWTDAAAMFLAVWILYAADRLLDAKPLFTAPSSLDLEERHHFHHRHRRHFFPAILCAAIPLVLLLHRTADAVLHLYVLLASLLGVWLLLIHARPAPSSTAHRLPKELAVGIFFSAAIFIPTVARASALRPVLAPQALAFGALCTLNCLFLFAWEHPHGAHHAHPTTRWAIRHLTALTITAALASGALALAGTVPQAAVLLDFTPLPDAAAPLLACSLSCLLLLLLHRVRHSLRALTLRAAADLVLLTPIPIALALHALAHHR